MSRIFSGPGFQPRGSQDINDATALSMGNSHGEILAARLRAQGRGSPSAWSRDQLQHIAQNSDYQLYWSDLLTFGWESQRRGEVGLATAIFTELQNSAPDPKLRCIAQSALAGLNGQGASTGARLEFLSHSWLEKAADPALLLGMLGAGLAYRGGRALSYQGLRRLDMGQSLGPWGLKSFSALGGFVAEVPAFVFTERLGRGVLGAELSWEQWVLQEELLGSALVLGALKLSGLGSGMLLQKLHGMGARSAGLEPQRLAGWYPISSKVLPQGGMLGGILLGQGAEAAYFHREEADGWVKLLDGLAMLLQFNAAGRLLPQRALGKRDLGETFLPPGASWKASPKRAPVFFPGPWALAGMTPGRGGRPKFIPPMVMMTSEKGPKGGGGGPKDPKPSLDRFLIQLPSGRWVRLQERKIPDPDANNWTLIEIAYKNLIFSPTQEIGQVTGRQIKVPHLAWKDFRLFQGRQFDFIPYLGPMPVNPTPVSMIEAMDRVRKGNPQPVHLEYLLETAQMEGGYRSNELLLGLNPAKILTENGNPRVVEQIFRLYRLGNRFAQMALMNHDFSYFSPDLLHQSRDFLEGVLLASGNGSFNPSAVALLREVKNWEGLHRQSREDLEAFITLLKLGEFQESALEWVEHWDHPKRLGERAENNWDDLIRLALLVKTLRPKHAYAQGFFQALNQVSMIKYFSEFLQRPEYFLGLQLIADAGHLEAMGFLHHATIAPEVFNDLHRGRNFDAPWLEITGKAWMSRLLARWSLKQPKLLERLERHIQEKSLYEINAHLGDGANSWFHDMARRLDLLPTGNQTIYRAHFMGIKNLAGKRLDLSLDRDMDFQPLLIGWETDPGRVLALNSLYRSAGVLGWDQKKEAIARSVIALDLSLMNWEFLESKNSYQRERTRLALGALAHMGNRQASQLLMDVMTWDFHQDQNPWLNLLERENLLGVEILLEQAAEDPQALKLLKRLSDAGMDDLILDIVESEYPRWPEFAANQNASFIPAMGSWYLGKNSLLALRSLESLASTSPEANRVWQALGYKVAAPFKPPPEIHSPEMLSLVGSARTSPEMLSFLRNLSQDPQNPLGEKWSRILKVLGPEFDESS